MEARTEFMLNELKRYVSVFLHKKINRTQKRVQDTYNDGFHISKLKAMTRKNKRGFVLDGRIIKTTRQEYRQYYVGAHYKNMLEHIGKAKNENIKVLEVGSGYGRTFFPLSSLFPNWLFYGIEYSSSGPKTAKIYEQEYLDDIKAVASSVAKFHHKEKLAESFVQGDAKNLDYEDKTFDISYTNLVFEQIPKEEDYVKIFKEMKRVTKRFCCFLEPWKDAQNFFTDQYVKRIDYFRASSQLLKKLGYEKVHYCPLNFSQSLRYKLGYVVAEV